MSLIDTINYFIQDTEGDLQCYEWDIREETNQENPDLDWYCEQYDLCKQRIEDLKQIKSILEEQQMTDLSKLSFKELQQLEKQIEDRKYELRYSKDCVEGYKITFCVKFNPATNTYSDLRSPEDFGDYLANDVANLIVNDFGLQQSDVSSFEVEWMTDEYKVEWKDFWENDE